MPAPKDLPSSLLQLRTILFALVAQRFSSSAPEPRLESRHLYPGHRMASNQVSAMLFPEDMGPPVLMPVVESFRGLCQWFACARLSNPHMTRESRLFRERSPPPSLDGSSSRLFEACSCKPAP